MARPSLPVHRFGGVLYAYGKLLQAMGRLQDAEALLRESLDMRRSDPDLGPDHSKTKESLESLRSLLQDMGRLDAAEDLTAS